MGAVLRHQTKEQAKHSEMDQERMEGEEAARMIQGSLLNKVYEIQLERERQFKLISQMMKMSVSPYKTLTATGCQAQGPGERVQQDMELSSNPAYAQYMLERTLLDDNNCNPHNQLVKRHDPVIAFMANQGVGHQQHQHHNQAEHHQQLEIQHQQQLELQQRSCQNQVLAEQLGGFVSPIRHPDLIPLMDSMQIE